MKIALLNYPNFFRVKILAYIFYQHLLNRMTLLKRDNCAAALLINENARYFKPIFGFFFAHMA